MSSTSSKPRRKVNHFKKAFRRPKGYTLELNARGFLCSCNMREKDCIREAYNILNKYGEDLFPNNQPMEAPQISDDIEDDLSAEISNLKAAKRFQVVESGAKNFLFIRTTLEDPVKLAHHIISDIYTKKEQQTRYLIRLIPVETVCKAYIGDIEKAIDPILERYFKNEPKTFSVIFNHRNNNHVSKDEVIRIIADKVIAIRNDHKVSLKDAELSIVVEVIRNMALLAVVPDFLKYKKYNLHMVSQQDISEATDIPERVPEVEHNAIKNAEVY